MKTLAPLGLLAGVALLVLAGCTRTETEAGTPPKTPAFQEIASPASPGSGLPNFYTTLAGTVFLSWVEPAGDDAFALRFARLEAGAWSAPQTIATGDDWFINWADFPSIVALNDSTLAAHFLAKSGPDTYAYDVKITQSHDGGQTWSPALKPHRDGTQTEHGFVSMAPWHDDRLLAVWLDGRNTGGGHDGHGSGAMTLRAATLDAEGQLADEALLDERICDCCQTSIASTPDGAIAAYRDRSDTEIRDIAVVRLNEDGWTEPQTVYADGWEIAGCPVNGPAIAAHEAHVAVAWFTAADDTPRVRLALSSDGGATFGPALSIDEGQPIGRVDVAVLDDGGALVSWVEKTGEGAAIRLRHVRPDGTPAPSMLVAPTSPARASGFPQLTRFGNTVYMAWTEAGEPLQVHTAVATL